MTILDDIAFIVCFLLWVDELRWCERFGTYAPQDSIRDLLVIYDSLFPQT
jgi:hypothetical protein